MPEQLRVPAEFKPNDSLPPAIRRAAFKELRLIEVRKWFDVVKCLRDRDFRFMLETQLTDMAMRSGAIPPTGGSVQWYGEGNEAVPVFVGNWLTDLMDWIIANAPAIIELIMTIIALFAKGELTAQQAAGMIALLLLPFLQ